MPRPPPVRSADQGVLHISYQGITQAGGHIEADLIIRDGRVHAVLSADAFVLRGGTYTGTIRT